MHIRWCLFSGDERERRFSINSNAPAYTSGERERKRKNGKSNVLCVLTYISSTGAENVNWSFRWWSKKTTRKCFNQNYKVSLVTIYFIIIFQDILDNLIVSRRCSERCTGEDVHRGREGERETQTQGEMNETMNGNDSYMGDEDSFFYRFKNIYLPFHGYLSIIVCIFGIVTNIANIIVLTRWVWYSLFPQETWHIARHQLNYHCASSRG